MEKSTLDFHIHILNMANFKAFCWNFSSSINLFFWRVLSNVMIYDESFHRTLILNCTFIYRYWNQPTVQQTTMASKVRSTYNVTRSVSTLKNFETNIVCQGSTNEAYMCRLATGLFVKNHRNIFLRINSYNILMYINKNKLQSELGRTYNIISQCSKNEKTRC